MNFTDTVKKYHAKSKTPQQIVDLINERGIKTKAGGEANLTNVRTAIYSINTEARKGAPKDVSPGALRVRKYREKSKIFDPGEETKAVDMPIEIKYTPTTDKVAIVFTTRSNVAEVIRSYLEAE